MAGRPLSLLRIAAAELYIRLSSFYAPSCKRGVRADGPTLPKLNHQPYIASRGRRDISRLRQYWKVVNQEMPDPGTVADQCNLCSFNECKSVQTAPVCTGIQPAIQLPGKPGKDRYGEGIRFTGLLYFERLTIL